MKKIKFEDLKFESHPSGLGEQAILKFENNYAVSVVVGLMFYSNGLNTYELAVLKDDGSEYDLDYDNPVSNGDVVGYLEKNKLMSLINRVANFKK